MASHTPLPFDCQLEVIVPLVSLFTRKPDKALVENAFSSYDKKVLVYQREALADEESE